MAGRLPSPAVRAAHHHTVTLDDGRLPIVLGITGHRDVAHADQLRALLEREIGWVVAHYPDSPVIALSPLAEGADRLFAHAALAIGIPLYVVLPLEASDYEQDFPATVNEFRALCSQAEAVFPARFGGSADAEWARATAHGALDDAAWSRKLAYAKVGIYVAQRTHILYALSDGLPGHGLGGTAEIMNYKATGHLGSMAVPGAPGIHALNPILFHWLDEPEPGCAVEIRVQRHATATPAFTAVVPRPNDALLRTRKMLQRLNDANRAMSELAGQSEPAAPRTVGARPHTRRPAPLPDTAVSGDREARRLLLRARTADKLANRHVTGLRSWFALLFALAGCAVAADVAFAEVVEPYTVPGLVALLAYLALLALIGTLIFWLRRQTRTFEASEYRALAEGLRVQAAWHRAGIADLAGRHYLRRHNQLLAWLSFALRGATPVTPATPGADDINAVRNGWIRNQTRYFGYAVAARRSLSRLFSRLSKILYFGGLAAALGALVAVLLDLAITRATHAGRWYVPTLDTFMALQSFLLAVAAILASYKEFGAYEEEIREYGRIATKFRLCAELIGSVESPQQQAMLHELGIEAISENAEWTIIHEARNGKMPL